MTKALIMFSGWLDSLLAIKILEKQWIDCTGLCFTTPFFGKEKAEKQAEKFWIKLMTKDIASVHFDVLKDPQYWYGKNMNPCIDCHGFMFSTAWKIADELWFDIIASWEVLWQRPMSQNKQALWIVNKLAWRDVLRPMSAKLMEETTYEKEWFVDREQLLDISGRGRWRQIEMTEEYWLEWYTSPGGWCLLTEPGYSNKLRKLIELEPTKILSLDAELIKYGRLDIVNTSDHKFYTVTGRDKDTNFKLMDIVKDKNNPEQNDINKNNTYYIIDLDWVMWPTLVLRILANNTQESSNPHSNITPEIELEIKKIFRSKMKKLADIQDSELKLKIKTVV